ncbi:unnamed protein product [Gongylonema pulchrum]|uniref:Methionine--tRNA ligase, cytoplasmic n=1 Tax=Gongylonema pulchrum TaxID=637853 RepID=A0A183EVJ1_9BILA|nr:unnamed protein product [Gongylonema pulchrum]
MRGAQYCRLKGWRCLFICGTDEYGTATETKALQEGLTPREICDKYHAVHAEIYKWFNIEFDHFGRTTTEYQTELTQNIFLKIHANGYTSTDTIDQLHCNNCKKFLADRFVHGECPYCHFEDARGDQCDACSKLINAVELIDPRCQQCKGTPTDEVEKYINKQLNVRKSQWSTNAVSIARSWLKGGLEKRCITRDLKWGVPVPLQEFSNKVCFLCSFSRIALFQTVHANIAVLCGPLNTNFVGSADNFTQFNVNLNFAKNFSKNLASNFLASLLENTENLFIQS